MLSAYQKHYLKKKRKNCIGTVLLASITGTLNVPSGCYWESMLKVTTKTQRLFLNMAESAQSGNYGIMSGKPIRSRNHISTIQCNMVLQLCIFTFHQWTPYCGLFVVVRFFVIWMYFLLTEKSFCFWTQIWTAISFMAKAAENQKHCSASVTLQLCYLLKPTTLDLYLDRY